MSAPNLDDPLNNEVKEHWTRNEDDAIATGEFRRGLLYRKRALCFVFPECRGLAVDLALVPFLQPNTG